MKKYLIACLLVFAAHASAQQVYNELKQNAQALISNSQTAPTIKKINQFKVDALNYLAVTMREKMPTKDVAYLDRQAYAMNSFVNFYIQQIVSLSQQPQALQVWVTEQFMQASHSHPLFHDKDEDLTLSYYRNGDCLTRFSLDTDWEEALKAIQKTLEKKD